MNWNLYYTQAINFSYFTFLLVLVFLPLGLFLYNGRYQVRPYHYVFYFLFYKLTCDLWMFHLAALHENNIYLINLTAVAEIIFFGLFYTSTLLSYFAKTIIRISTACWLAFFFWELLMKNQELRDLHNHTYLSQAATAECVLILLWVLLFFYETIRDMRIPNLLESSAFWISTGLLFYFAAKVCVSPFMADIWRWNHDIIPYKKISRLPYYLEPFMILAISNGIRFIPKYSSSRSR